MTKVLTGLSGGVDSAVTAALLKMQGYEVIGITMAIWGDKNGTVRKNTHGACLSPDEKEDIETARKISENLNIPYHVIDCSKEYDEIVLKYFRNEYLSGRTPNPCIRCNSLVKFGVLPDLARKRGISFDKFASGHYARVFEQCGIYYLAQAKDKLKDQSYFLYRLTQEQLKHVLFPLGDYTKNEVREMAKDFNLEVSDKPESQDFYAGDYNELLKTEGKEGKITDLNGKVLGIHNGIWNYTIGQRKGLGVFSSEPLYVIKLDKETNTVVVGNIDNTFNKSLIAADTHFPSGVKIKNGKYFAKIRSTQKPQECYVDISGDKLNVEFTDYQKSVAKGQSVVIYDNETVVAGGIIEEIRR